MKTLTCGEIATGAEGCVQCLLWSWRCLRVKYITTSIITINVHTHAPSASPLWGAPMKTLRVMRMIMLVMVVVVDWNDQPHQRWVMTLGDTMLMMTMRRRETGDTQSVIVPSDTTITREGRGSGKCHWGEGEEGGNDLGVTVVSTTTTTPHSHIYRTPSHL